MMTEETIMRYEVLKLMDTGDPFDLTYITADRKRGTGGEIKEVKSYAKICGEKSEVRLPGQFRKVKEPTRNPNHSEHKTINIFSPENPTEHPKTVHWRLMIFFNHKRIIG